MPSNYAHYRFGAQLLKTLPHDVRRTVNRYRRLYDMGLHGPDIFRYTAPGRKNAGDPAEKFHSQSGRDFFTRVCKRHRLEPSEPARAYLYGLLAHYCLDSACRSFLKANSGDGFISQAVLETEFDRYLLEKDGKCPAHIQDCSRHMQLEDSECAVAAGFYPSVTAAQVGQCVRNMALVTRLLASPNAAARKVLEGGLKLAGARHHVLMKPEADPSLAPQMAELETLYAMALANYPVLLKQIMAYLTCSVPLGQEFGPAFH